MLKDKRYLFGFGTGLIIAAVLLELMRFAEAGTNTSLLPPDQSTQQVYSVGDLQPIAEQLGYVVHDKTITLYTQQQLDELLEAAQRGDETAADGNSGGGPHGDEQPAADGYSIYIKPGLSSAQVSELLAEAGLVADAESFTEELHTRGLSYKIRAGLYDFEEAPDLEALIKAITSL